jgi:hypothetical protein
MFGLGKVRCILCDHRVARKQVLAVRNRKGFAVCRRCVERWHANGGTCPTCHAPLRDPQEAGIVLEGKRASVHGDCGALDPTLV